jgi:hypothetical protein
MPNPDTEFSIIIRPEQQQMDSDEQILHSYHVYFHKLVNLLLTDIGDDGPHSLRVMVQEWEDDQSRILLTVMTGRARWTLQKSAMEGPDQCRLCAESHTRSGLALDHNLEVISNSDAETIANYLQVAIQHSRHGTNSEEARQLEQIRDSVSPRPAAPPSIRDDVSVSVPVNRGRVAPSIAELRKKRDNKQVFPPNTSVNKPDTGITTPSIGNSRVHSEVVTPSLESPSTLALPSSAEVIPPPKLPAATPDNMVLPTRRDESHRKSRKEVPKSPPKPQRSGSIMFLGPHQIRKIYFGLISEHLLRTLQILCIWPRLIFCH